MLLLKWNRLEYVYILRNSQKRDKFEDTWEENDTWDKVTKKKEEVKVERTILKQEGFGEVKKSKAIMGQIASLKIYVQVLNNLFANKLFFQM